MEIEQPPSNKPSFGKVVGITAAALLVLFLLAYLTLRKDHALPGHYNKYPTTRLRVPQSVAQLNC